MTTTIQPIDQDNYPDLQDGQQLCTASDENEISLRSASNTARNYTKERYRDWYREEGYKLYLLTAEQAADYPHSTPSIDATTGNLILTPRNNKHDRYDQVRHIHQVEDGIAEAAEMAIEKAHEDSRALWNIFHYITEELKDAARGTDSETRVAAVADKITEQVNTIRSRVINSPYSECVLLGGRLRAVAVTGPDGVHEYPLIYIKAEAVELMVLERYFDRTRTTDDYTGEITETVEFSDITNALFDGELRVRSAQDIAPNLRKILYREIRKTIADNPMQDAHFDNDGQLNDAGTEHYTTLLAAADITARELMVAEWRATLS